MAPAPAVQNAAPACAAANSALPAQAPEWHPRPNQPHGEQEFLATTRIAWPSKSDSVVVELWGAGGGGGGGSADTWGEGGAGGGGGAGGAYVRRTISTTAGASYTLLIGRGGSPGPVSSAGSAGGDTALCLGDQAIAIASGGEGGQGAKTNARGGVGGRGASMSEDASDGLRRDGEAGSQGLRPLFKYAGAGGAGGHSITGTVTPPGAFGGTGGKGEMRPDPPFAGSPGATGSAVLRW
jgi:hypothetical protein